MNYIQNFYASQDIYHWQINPYPIFLEMTNAGARDKAVIYHCRDFLIRLVESYSIYQMNIKDKIAS